MPHSLQQLVVVRSAFNVLRPDEEVCVLACAFGSVGLSLRLKCIRVRVLPACVRPCARACLRVSGCSVNPHRERQSVCVRTGLYHE